MHVICSGAKAYFTEYPLAHIETIRLSCGGHGFSHFSGIPAILENFKASVTVEGENTILYLQVARFLVKSFIMTMKGIDKSKIPASV
jgi:alkylation response protein AidB-like acyl-CoA dehydrogenase